MAAPTQTAADKAGITLISQATTEGVYMVRMGSILVGMGTGTANGEVTAPIGSLWVNKTTGELEINTDAGTTWAHVGAQS